MAADPEDARSDEEYDENADEDFNPDEAAAGDGASSSSDDDEEAPAATKKQTKKSAKRKTAAVDELDSGDEATIKERKRKKRKQRDDESGDEGGVIKTRAQRLVETAERKERKRMVIGDVTIDVDDIWNELSNAPVGRVAPPPPKPVEEADSEDEEDQSGKKPTDELITIKRRVEYAGEVTEVEEQVPRSSNEAQAYLAEHPEADPNYKPKEDESEGLLRPLRRPSMFEPNPAGLVKGVPPDRLRPRAPSRFDTLMLEKRAEEERKKKAEKMTTVQKSALDWKGFVEKEGLREELDAYGKSKSGYLQREEFLGRAQLMKEEAGRAARLKG